MKKTVAQQYRNAFTWYFDYGRSSELPRMIRIEREHNLPTALTIEQARLNLATLREKAHNV